MPAAERLLESPSIWPHPGSGAKHYYYVMIDELEQRELFLKNLAQATANALPLPKPKSAKRVENTAAEAHQVSRKRWPRRSQPRLQRSRPARYRSQNSHQSACSKAAKKGDRGNCRGVRRATASAIRLLTLQLVSGVSVDRLLARGTDAAAATGAAPSVLKIFGLACQHVALIEIVGIAFEVCPSGRLPQ